MDSVRVPLFSVQHADDSVVVESSSSSLRRKKNFLGTTTVLLGVGLIIVVVGCILLVLGLTGILSNPDDVAADEAGRPNYPDMSALAGVEVSYFVAKSNCLPGGQLSYPRSPGAVAGGVGSYDNPITFSADPRVFRPGTRVYNPTLRKYFIMEDYCMSCSLELNATGLVKIQVWLGPDFSVSDPSLVSCGNDLSKANQTLVVNPPPKLPSILVPLYNAKTNTCILPNVAECPNNFSNTCGPYFSCSIPYTTTCGSLAIASNLTLARFSALNPSLNCELSSSSVSQGADVCFGNSCGS